MLLMTMTATSMLFAKIPRAHTRAHAKPDIQETDEPVLVRFEDVLLPSHTQKKFLNGGTTTTTTTTTTSPFQISAFY